LELVEKSSPGPVASPLHRGVRIFNREDETTTSLLRSKIGKGELLTRKEDRLRRLGDKAREWRKAVKTSSEAEPGDTLSG
jgi:hypothetical protein